MAAARRKKSTRKSQGTPGWMWLLTGLLIGLGLAYYLWSKGYIPQPGAEPTASGKSDAQSTPAGSEEVAPAKDDPPKSRYDFFTVLPEMEVVVPEQELAKKSQPAETTAKEADTVSYVLQVGSFREQSDAEQMKARLALLGVTARIQTVTVNDATWHRVRVGPVSGARQADTMRNQLANNGIESLVMKNQ
ncbi:SPOR domain-containing protein [Pseudomonadota bacterium]